MDKVHLTQKEFCKLMGITYQTLWSWIKNNKIKEDFKVIILPSGRKRIEVDANYPGAIQIVASRERKQV